MADADLAAFDAEDFDVQGWVNAVLSSAPDKANGEDVLLRPGLLPTPQEQFAQLLVGRLQGLEEELNDGVERSMKAAAARLPQLLHEVERLEGSITSCEADMKHLAAATEGVDGDEPEAVALLAQMEAAQERMDVCLSSLKETARWQELLRLVSAAVAGSANPKAEGEEDAPDVTTAVDALEDMAACAETLKVLPGAAERAKTLAELRGEFERVLAPQVAAALGRGAAGRLELEPYVAVYRKIGKMDILETAYCTALPKRLHKRWYAFAPGRDALRGWMADFHQDVLVWWAEEKGHATELLNADEAELLRRAAKQLWEPLAGDFARRLSVAAEADPADGPALLADVYDASLSTHASLFGGDAEAAADAWASAGLEACYEAALRAYPKLEARGAAAAAKALLDTLAGAGDTNEDADIFGADDALGGVALPAALRRLASELGAPAAAALARARRVDCGAVPAVAAAVDEDGIGAVLRGAAAALSEAAAAPLDEGSSSWARLSEALAALAAAGAVRAAAVETEAAVAAAIAPLRGELLGGAPIPGADGAGALRAALAARRVHSGHRRSELAAALGAVDVNGAMPQAAKQGAAAADAACSHVFAAAFGGIKRVLATVHALEGWGDNDDGAAAEMGVGPGTAMTAVSDQLFDMLQCIENWCASEEAVEALSAMEVTRCASAAAWSCAAVRKVWDDLGLALSVSDAERETFDRVVLGVALKDVDGFMALEHDDEDDDEVAEAGPRDGAWICNSWLHALGSGVVAQLAAQVLMVPRFSERGSRQLATDASYLVNVFEGLGIAPHPLLRHLQYLASCGAEALQERLNDRAASNPTAKLMSRFDGAFGRARGLMMAMEKR